MKIAEEAVGIVKGEASVIGYDFSAHPEVNLQFGEFVVAQTGMESGLSAQSEDFKT